MSRLPKTIFVLILFAGGVEWNSAVYKLEGSGNKEGGRKSSRWHGVEEMGILISFSESMLCLHCVLGLYFWNQL